MNAGQGFKNEAHNRPRTWNDEQIIAQTEPTDGIPTAPGRPARVFAPPQGLCRSRLNPTLMLDTARRRGALRGRKNRARPSKGHRPKPEFQGRGEWKSW